MRHDLETLADMALFVEVARVASFRAAAARLQMPVATLSRRMAALERRLGTKLLLRTTRSVSLVKAAEPFFEQCVQVVQAAEQARATLAGEPGGIERIRISMPVDLGVDMLGPLVADYASRREGLHIVFDLTSHARDLLRDPVDLAFRIGRPLDERVVARQVGEIAAGLFASPACLQRHGLPGEPADLQRMPCLDLLTSAAAMPWVVAGHRWSSAPGRVAFSANSVGLLRSLAERGHGMALLPLHMALRSVQAGTLVQVLPQVEVQGWALYALTATRSLSVRTRELLAHVRERLNGFSGSGPQPA
jgi:DNA-binding transcriptional LysR family regulator